MEACSEADAKVLQQEQLQLDLQDNRSDGSAAICHHHVDTTHGITKKKDHYSETKRFRCWLKVHQELAIKYGRIPLR